MSATPGGGAGSARRSSRPPDVPVPDTLLHELTRLRNELKVKDAAIEVSQLLTAACCGRWQGDCRSCRAGWQCCRCCGRSCLPHCLLPSHHRWAPAGPLRGGCHAAAPAAHGRAGHPAGGAAAGGSQGSPAGCRHRRPVAAQAAGRYKGGRGARHCLAAAAVGICGQLACLSTEQHGTCGTRSRRTLCCLHGLPLLMQMCCVQAERDALRRDNESSERGALRLVAWCKC